jgi:type I restriction modification DNA specificity domain protein
MTAQDLKNSILQLAVQGKLVSQRKTEASVDLSGLKQKKTNECEFDIPNSWRFAHLETITRGVPSKQYQILESEVKQDSRFPVISQSKAYSIGFTDSEEKLYRHEDPVVIFGDHTTEIKFVDFDFVVGADGVKIFKPITSVITAKFLFYVLQFYSRDLHKVGGYSRHYKFIKNSPIPLPPLAEQERIVAKIEELSPLVSEYDGVEKRISALNTEFPDKLRKSILQQAMQGKLTDRDPSDEPAVELLKRINAEKVTHAGARKTRKGLVQSPIAEDEKPFDLPDTWEWVRFTDVIDVASNLVQPNDYLDYMHIAPDNIEKGTGKLFLCRTVAEDKVSSPNHLFGKNQLIYSKIRPLLRKVAIAPFDGLCSADMYPLKTILHTNYVKYVILSDVFNNQVAKIASTRVKMPKINQTELGQIIIPLPPLDEQRRIADRIEELLAACKVL